MRTRTLYLVVALAVTTTAATLAAPAAPLVRAAAAAQQQQQQQYGALERGYRTGYSDGYQAGWSDQLRGARADHRAKADYRRADRAYVAAYGSLEDYRDGYRQGFERGYNAGYSRGGFQSEIPAGGVTRRGTGDEDFPADNGARTNDAGVGSNDDNRTASGASVRVPSHTVLLVELENRLSTDVSQRGDRFEARVLEPVEYEGAQVGGRLTQVQRAGRARGRSQLQLDFDQIRMPGGEWQDFNAQVIEVVDRGGDDNVGDVDPEGGVRGKSTTKDDIAKVGAGAGVGAIIGAIAGGGKGAGIGAIIGGSVGTAGVLSERGKDIRLERGQRLRIRTSR